MQWDFPSLSPLPTPYPIPQSAPGVWGAPRTDLEGMQVEESGAGSVAQVEILVLIEWVPKCNIGFSPICPFPTVKCWLHIAGMQPSPPPFFLMAKV